MSFRKEQYLLFQNIHKDSNAYYAADMSDDDIANLYLEILNNGIHGFCFSLYADGQKPGDVIPESQIRRRLEILKPHCSWIRSFSTIEGNELIPKVAKSMGMKTLVGAWLGSDKDKNEQEIEGLIELGKQGLVDIAAVGNEVLYRNDLSLEELICLIERVKSELPNIPVSYVDAYYEFTRHPNLTAICDVILANCYPYWEGTSLEDSLYHIQHMYRQTKGVAGGKQVIITETGWPSKGEPLGLAMPGDMNAKKYFINTQLWAMDEAIEMFYFSSFDESWKVDAEGEVGAYWGIWDKHEKLKI